MGHGEKARAIVGLSGAGLKLVTGARGNYRPELRGNIDTLLSHHTGDRIAVAKIAAATKRLGRPRYWDNVDSTVFSARASEASRAARDFGDDALAQYTYTQRAEQLMLQRHRQNVKTQTICK